MTATSTSSACVTPGPLPMQAAGASPTTECEFAKQLLSLMANQSMDSGDAPKDAAVGEEQPAQPAQQKKREELPVLDVIALFAAMLPAPPPAGLGLPSAGDEAGAAPVGSEAAPAVAIETPVMSLAAPSAPNGVPDPSAELAFALRLVDQTPNRDTAPKVPAVAVIAPAPQPVPQSVPTPSSAPQSPAPTATIAATPRPAARPSESGRSTPDHTEEQDPQPASRSERPRAERQTTIAAAVVESREAPAQSIGPVAIGSAVQSPMAARNPAPATAVAANRPTETAPVVRPNPASEVTEVSVAVPSSSTDSAGEERIAIRMVQRGDEIHVSVRTPDRDAAQAMRQDLTRLASSLEDAGFHSESWRPAVSQVAAPAQTHTQREFGQDTSRQDTSGDHARSGGNGGGRGPGEQKRRQQDDRPQWVAELERQKNR